MSGRDYLPTFPPCTIRLNPNTLCAKIRTVRNFENTPKKDPKMPTPKDVFDHPLEYLEFLQSANFKGQYFERKEALINTSEQIMDLKDQIKKSISAFANLRSKGGLLVLGIANDGTIKGTQDVQEQTMKKILQVMDGLKNHATQMEDVEIPNSGGKRLHFLYTPWTKDAICETVGNFPKAWRRLGTECVALTDQDREQLKRDKRVVNFEYSYCCPYDPNELDERVVEEFKKAFLQTRGAQYSHNTEEALYQTGALIKEEGNGKYAFTNAGYLFFASNPRRRFKNAFVKVLKYDTCDKGWANNSDTILDRDFDGALPNVIRNLQAFLKESVLFQNLDEHEYPYVAVDEALVNAVIHRDYTVNTPIRCTAYKDKLIVENPGSILQAVPQYFNLVDITLEYVPRNPRIVEWMRLMKNDRGQLLVRALREGTERMRQEMHKMGLPPPYYETAENTTVILSF